MKAKVLIVDDDQDIVTMLQDRLDAGGYKTLTAGDGQRGLELIEQESPNLVLLDLYLPDGSYRYQAGWNWKAVAATVAGCFLAWGGLLIPLLRPLFDYAWFVGFLVSGSVYFALMQGETEPAALRPQAA